MILNHELQCLIARGAEASQSFSERLTHRSGSSCWPGESRRQDVTNRRSEALSADFPYVGDELHEATLVVSPVFRGRDLLKLI